jgi:hypothetical protein
MKLLMRTLILNIALFTAPALMAAPAAVADDACGFACCDQCGRRCDCLQKTCQLVCEVKKEKKTCWCVDIQEFCTLMPACPHLCHQCPDPPHCGKEKCVKKLVKKEYEASVPVYKCVVRYVCPACLNGGAANPPNAAPSPPSAPTVAPASPAPPMPSPPSNPK